MCGVKRKRRRRNEDLKVLRSVNVFRYCKYVIKCVEE